MAGTPANPLNQAIAAGKTSDGTPYQLRVDSEGRLIVAVLEPIEADIVIADMQAITGADPDAKSLFDLWTALGSPAQESTLGTMAQDVTNIAMSLGTPAQEPSNAEIMANTGTIASATVNTETIAANMAVDLGTTALAAVNIDRNLRSEGGVFLEGSAGELLSFINTELDGALRDDGMGAFVPGTAAYLLSLLKDATMENFGDQARVMAVELTSGGYRMTMPQTFPDGQGGYLYGFPVYIGQDPNNSGTPAVPHVDQGFLATRDTYLYDAMAMGGFVLPCKITDPMGGGDLNLTTLGGGTGPRTGNHLYDWNGLTGWHEAGAIAYGFEKWAAAVIDPGQDEYYDGFTNLYDNGSTAAYTLTIKARQIAMQVLVTATAFTAGTIALEGSLDNGYWAVLDSKDLTATGTYLLQSNALARYIRLTVTNNNATDVTYQPVFYAQR